MGILVALGVQAGVWLLSKWLAPLSPKEREARAADLRLPRAEQGTPLPLFWGRVRINTPTLVWSGGFGARAIREEYNDDTGWASDVITSNSATLGFEYRVSMQFVLGVPGYDELTSGVRCKLHTFWVGDKVAMAHTTSHLEEFQVDATDLLGGRGNGGGVRGRLTWYAGVDGQDYVTTTDDQDFVTLFETEMADWPPALVDWTVLLPRYMGMAMLTLANFEIGESATPEPFSFDVSAPTRTNTLGGTILTVGNDDANPVNVLYDLLIRVDAKVGMDFDDLDDASFLAAATVLNTEGNGFSYVLEDPGEASELIRIILTQIDGYLYVEPETSLLTLKLIRDDYTAASLAIFDESIILGEPSYVTSQWSETYQEIRVSYPDRKKSYDKETISVRNPASIAARPNERKKPLELHYPGCCTATNAAKLAERDLQAYSQPLAKWRINVNAEGFTLRPGSVFKISWADYGIVEMIVRVTEIDPGTLEDGVIVVSAVEDRFGINHTVFPPADWETLPLTFPSIVEERVATEAPRFLQRQALFAGVLGDADVQHGIYLAKAEGADIAYKAQALVSPEVGYGDDTLMLPFPPTFTVSTTYLRTLEPYDTTTGLVITGLTSDSPVTATTEQIQEGRNLILVGSELMAFEGFTGTGPYTLTNVWRGLLDTPAVEHLAGERGYFITEAYLGSRGLSVDDVVTARIIPRAALLQLLSPLAELDTFTVRGRCVLPYPPADLLLDSSKTPTALAEDGVDATWRIRDYLTDTVVRGNASNETTDDTTYDIVARKDDDAYQVITAAADINANLFDHVPLGQIGHGVIDVAVRAKRPDPEGGSDLTAWADPMLQITAHRWRNMLRNPRFAESPDLEHWSFSTDEVISTTASTALGGAGSFLTTNGVRPLGAQQDVNVIGYFPSRLRAILDFYARNYSADADDSLTVDLKQLDSDGSTVLVTTTYGPVVQSATLWAHLNISVANLHADCAFLRVLITGTRVGGTQTNIAVTECILRLGQISDQLLANPNFSAGAGTSWTEVAGTWQYLTTTKYVDGYYARPNDGAAAELAQTVSIPAGYNYGTVVLECARMNDDTGTDDTGSVVVEALDVSNVVVATATTGTEAMATIDIWERRRVTLELPDEATQVRVRAVATRVSGTPLNSCFDDFDVRIHKHLEPDYEKVLDMSEPTVQYLPATRSEWLRRIPTVDAPDYGFWGGADLTGLTGNEPDMESDDVTIGKLVGCWDGTTMATPAMCFPVGGAALTTGNVHYANFKSDQPFTIIATIKTTKVSSVICERLDTTGWSLDITAGGLVRARLVGSITVTATSTIVVTDGGVHQVAMTYNSATGLQLVVDGDWDTASTAGLGEIQMTGLVTFVIGDGFEGQIGRLTIHRQEIQVSDLQAMWTHAGDPTGGDITYLRAGTLAVTVGSDADGILVGRFGDEQVAVGYSTSLDGTGFGLAQVPDLANICPTNDMTAASWVNAGATLSYPEIDSPEGDRKVTRITGDSGDWLAMNFTHGAASTAVSVVFFARADVAHNCEVRITSDSSGAVETFTVALTTVWQRFDRVTALWGGADTGDGEVRFVPSTDGTSRVIDIAGPFFVGRTSVVPEAIPMPATTATHADARYVATMPVQFNHEGEVVVTAIARQSGAANMALVQIDNNNDFNDVRGLRLSTSAEPVLDHGDSGGTLDTSTGAAASWNDAFTVRGRWCRAGLLDAAASFAGVVNGSTLAADSDYGRVATWTATDVPLEQVLIGVDDPSWLSFNGLIQTVTLYARESRLPAA